MAQYGGADAVSPSVRIPPLGPTQLWHGIGSLTSLISHTGARLSLTHTYTRRHSHSYMLKHTHTHNYKEGVVWCATIQSLTPVARAHNVFLRTHNVHYAQIHTHSITHTHTTTKNVQCDVQLQIVDASSRGTYAHNAFLHTLYVCTYSTHINTSHSQRHRKMQPIFSFHFFPFFFILQSPD